MVKNNSGAGLVLSILSLIIDIALDSNQSSTIRMFNSDIDRNTKSTKSSNSGFLHTSDPFTSSDPFYKSNVKPNSLQNNIENEPSTLITPNIILMSSAKQIKLEVLLLSYMFEEDDGRISVKEKRIIKNHYKDSIKTLSNEDLDFIKDIKDNDNSLINIRAYISQQEVSEPVVKSSIDTLKLCNNNHRYDSIIRRIESALTDSIGY